MLFIFGVLMFGAGAFVAALLVVLISDRTEDGWFIRDKSKEPWPPKRNIIHWLIIFTIMISALIWIAEAIAKAITG